MTAAELVERAETFRINLEGALDDSGCGGCSAWSAGTFLGVTGTIKLVSFDRGGVLVDSERIAVKVDAQLLSAVGWPKSEAEVIQRLSAAPFEGEVVPVDRSAKWIQALAMRALLLARSTSREMGGLGEPPHPARLALSSGDVFGGRT
jgi:hypothetical protein